MDGDADGQPTIDIGSVELQDDGPLELFVGTTVDEIDDDRSPGDLSLREAILEANAFPGDVVIHLPFGLYEVQVLGIDEDDSPTGDFDITNTHGFVRIDGEVSSDGESQSLTEIAGGRHDRLFDIRPGSTAVISNLVIRDGETSDDSQRHQGGGIYNGGTLALENTVVANSFTSVGGGIFGADDTRVILSHNVVAGNVNSPVFTDRPPLNEDIGGEFDPDSQLIYNLVGAASAIPEVLLQAGQGNVTNIVAPGLLPLGNYGGLTETHALEADSPAVDAGNLEGRQLPITDRRGFARVVDGDFDGVSVIVRAGDVSGEPLKARERFFAELSSSRRTELTASRAYGPDLVPSTEYGHEVTNTDQMFARWDWYDRLRATQR